MARSSNESGKRKPEEDLCNSEKKAKKKVRLDPIEEKVDSIREDVDSIREDVDSMKAKLDLVLKAVLTPKKVKPATMKQSPEYIPSSSDSSANEQYLMPKTLYAANLAYKIKTSDMEDFFKDVGKIVDVQFQRRQCTALIEFSSTEEVKKALDLKGNILCKRPVHLARASNGIRTIYVSGLNRLLGGDELKKQLRYHFRGCGKIHRMIKICQGKRSCAMKTHVKAAPNSQRSSDNSSSNDEADPTKKRAETDGSVQTKAESSSSEVQACCFDTEDAEGNNEKTIFVKGFDSSLPRDDIKSALTKHFGPCGEITRVFVPIQCDTGVSLGFAFINFKQGPRNALKLNKSDMGGWKLKVKRAIRRDEYYGFVGFSGCERCRFRSFRHSHYRGVLGPCCEAMFYR